MNIGLVVQCHDNSTRFPKKSVRAFYAGKSILEIILEKLKILNNRIFVITTKDSPKTILQARKYGATVFIDRPKNLADSYLKLCVVYGLEGVIRICADNPFLSVPLIYPIMSWGMSGAFDYVSFTNCMNRHEGLWAEFIKAEALYRLANKTLTTIDKEHCTKYIYEHEKEFKVLKINVPPIMEKYHVRLTVDTKEDFFLAKRVYKIIKEKNWMAIYDLVKRNYSIRDKMIENILRSPK